MKQSRGTAGTRDCIQIFLDGTPRVIGTFYPNHGGHHGTHAFAYAPSWLDSPDFFDLDPHLQPWEGEQYQPLSLPIFGMLRDAMPDRWGRGLFDRWEAVAAGIEHRPIRKLDEVDYLLAVKDATRIGALRFCRTEGSFLKESTFPIHTLKELRSLADICLSIDATVSERHPEYSSRLAQLVSASAALGGARPKASYLDISTSNKGATQLWIAKFPAINDDYDVGAWEFLLNQLARKAGILVPDAKLIRLGGPHSTFCLERFDRQGISRNMYASAMTWLQRRDGDDDASYLDIAEFITTHSLKEMVSGQLEQLFRRLIFNILTGNRDDHLRNHGFVHERLGWRLSPAFDMNPSTSRKTHAIKIDDTSAVPDIDRVLSTSEVYRLSRNEATALLNEVASVVSNWRDEALRLRISRREIQLMEETISPQV